MEIYPAIDILGGKAVRLERGDYARNTVYSEDPALTALGFKSEGANNLHIVDLDGARDGTTVNCDIISRIVESAGLFTQVGGGIRDMERAARYIDLGVGRVILGTAAVKAPEFLKRAVNKYGAKIAVGVDVRDGKVAVSGWLEDTGEDGLEFVKRMRDIGVKTVIYTDISKDGMLGGPNHGVYEALAKVGEVDIIASGGVSSASDVERLSATGIHGAIIGKALYTGALTLADALAASGA